jgi:hypothetical protein
MGHALAQEEISQAPADDPRTVLRAEREAQTLRLDQAERACYGQFFTSNCLRDVARNRRTLLADIKLKEAALDTADRLQRAQDADRRHQEKLREQAQRQNEIDPQVIGEAQREKLSAQEAKQQEHAARANTVVDPATGAASAPYTAVKSSPVPSPPKPAKIVGGPSAAERAANQAAFDRKQAEAQRRMAERAKGAASAASAAQPLPLPPAEPAQ